MATRFYFDRPTAPAVSPTPDSGWDYTAVYLKRLLTPKNLTFTKATLASSGGAVVLRAAAEKTILFQLVGPPMPPQLIGGTVTAVVFMSASSAATVHAKFSLVVRVVGGDGSIYPTSTVLSAFSVDANELTTTDTTYLANAQTLTSQTVNGGDRLVVEIGVQTTGTAGGSVAHTNGYSAASDYAFTSGLTTNLNPWIEFSSDIETGGSLPGNYQSIKVGDGMSASGGIR